MIDLDTGMIIDDDESQEEEEPEDIQEVRDFLMTCEDTFTDLLDEEDDEVQAFLKDFDIDTKTEEISKLLESHPDTLQATFTQLTSDVAYLDFWKRYFFRFGDEERMRDLYSLLQQREASQKRQAAGSGFSGLSGVTNFLGGAVKAFVDDGGDGNHDMGGQQHQHTSTGVMNLFGASGRPPFVMNTAVSENGDDDQEEEEEEEELGWDDDDEDSDGDGDDFADDSRDSHQIEFKDAAKEKLQEELDQAMAERDQLHKTVEMQSQELKTLKEVSLDHSGNKQVEILEMQIFEKDAELAALRASLDDTSDDDDQGETSKKDAARQASQGRELERLTNEVATKDSRISELQEEVQSMLLQVQSADAGADTSAQAMAENARLKEEIQDIAAELQTQKDTVDQVLAEKSETQSEVQSLQETVSSLKSENAGMRESLKASGGEQASQLASAQHEALQAQAQVEALQEQLISLQSDLEVTNQRAAGLESDLQATTQAFAEKEAKKDEEMEALLEASKESIAEKESGLAEKEAQLSQMQVLLAKTEAELVKAKEAPPPFSPASISTGVKIPVEEPLDEPDEDGEDTPQLSPASTSSTGVKIPVENPLDVPVEGEPEEEAKPSVTKLEGAGDDGNEEEDAWDDDW
jgi:hypothetical protein